MVQPTTTTEWSDPGVYEVADGVHRLPLPLPNDGLRAVNVYVIVESEAIVCVDAGWAIPESRSLLLDGLAALDCGPEDIRRFLVTHIHRDHYSQAVALRRDFATPVSLGAGEGVSIEEIHRADYAPFVRRMEQLQVHGAGELAARLERERDLEGPDLSDWEMPDTWLADGDVVPAGDRRLRVVETPGHTRGHVVFHDHEGALLFAGDHVLPTITPSIGFEVAPMPNPLRDYLGSLARVRALPDAMLLPAHGPVVPSTHARIDELVEHHGARLDQSLAALEAGAETGFEVAEHLRWTRRERTFGELDLFNQMLAVTETVAHLVLLESQGRVRRELDDGVYRYAAL